MSDNPSTEPGAKPPVSTARRWAFIVYAVVLVILVKLYWPGWLSPSDRPATPPPPPAATSGPQVPQN